jgi:hypothetical protein
MNASHPTAEALSLPAIKAQVLAPYRPLSEVTASVERLAEKAEGTVRIIGHSVQNRPIQAVHLHGAVHNAPSVLVCANIHGIEYIAVEVALGLLQQAGHSNSGIAQLREQANVWIIPTLNPDAYERTWRQNGCGVLSELRTNANGVDLNRNFPKPGQNRRTWIDFGGWRLGSEDPKNAFFRGDSPLSEPETSALASLHQQVPFHASANLHSTMGTIIPPCVQTGAEYRHYGALARAFRDGQHKWGYRRMANRWFDRYTGEQEDFQHELHHTWAVCVEHYPLWVQPWRFRPGNPLFWKFNPRRPAPWVANDIPGIVSFFKAALQMPPPSHLG